MVVEDDKDIREIIGQVLGEENYEVELLGDVRSFRKAILYDRPSLVILDAKLPDGSGQSLCRELKVDERSAHVPVLMISAHSGAPDMARRCHADDFLAKPFDIGELVGRIGRFLN